MRRELRELIDSHSREYWEKVIFSWVHSEVDRQILVRNLLDGISLSDLPKEIAFEKRTIERHYDKALNQLLRHIDIKMTSK